MGENAKFGGIRKILGDLGEFEKVKEFLENFGDLGGSGNFEEYKRIQRNLGVLGGNLEEFVEILGIGILIFFTSPLLIFYLYFLYPRFPLFELFN